LLPVPAVLCCASAVVLFAALAAAVAAVCLQPVPGLWPQQPDAAAPHWYRQQAVPVPVPALAVRQPQQLTVRLPVVAVPVSARLRPAPPGHRPAARQRPDQPLASAHPDAGKRPE